MDAVEAGETYHATCNGVGVAKLRPLSRRRLTAKELVDQHRKLPLVDHARVWQEADEFDGGVAVAKDAVVRAVCTEAAGSGHR